MDVAGDVILRDSGKFELQDRSKLELEFLTVIEGASVEAKVRCKLVRQIIEGTPIAEIEQELKKESDKEPK
jgi:hypothetical protein